MSFKAFNKNNTYIFLNTPLTPGVEIIEPLTNKLGYSSVQPIKPIKEIAEIKKKLVIIKMKVSSDNRKQLRWMSVEFFL